MLPQLRRCLACWALLAAWAPAVAEATVQACGSSGFSFNGNPYSLTTDASACNGEPNGFSGLCAVVAGGVGNNATGTLAMIAGGSNNVAAGEYSNINGGTANTVNGSLAVVGGGSANTAAASAFHAVIAGGYSNYVSGENAGVASGSHHVITGIGSFVGGGSFHIVPGSSAFVGGGLTNTADGNVSTVAGGQANRAADFGATIGGGSMNSAANVHATVVGGYGNAADGGFSAVAGGSLNVASGQWSFVAAGQGSRAAGTASATLGSMATASHDHSAVLSFANDTCISNGNKTVSICASQGLYLNGERVDTELQDHATSLEVLQANASAQSVWLTTIAESVTTHRADIDELQLDVAASKEANVSLSATVSSNQIDIANLETGVGDLTAVISGINSTVTVNEADIAVVESDVATLQGAVVNVSAATTVNEADITVLESDVATLQGVVVNVSAAAAVNEAHIAVLESDVADAHSRITELNGSNIAASLRTLGIGVTSLETNISTLDVSVGSLGDSIDNVNVSLQSLQTAVSQLNSTKSLTAIHALGVDVAVNREAIADLVANDSLLVAAVGEVASNLQLLRGTMDENVSVSGLARGVDALNGTLQLQQQTLASADTNIADNRQQLDSLHGAVDNHSTQIEWLMENVTTQDAQILRLDAHLSNHLASAQSLIDNLTSTVSSQKKVIEGQASTIAALNATTEEQQHHIERLESTINDFNATLSAVMVTIEQLSTATTFADVVETTSSLVNCADDTNGPCSTTVDTATTYAGTSTTFASPTAALHVCYYYPCDEDEVLGAIAWSQDLIVVASVDAEALEYTFTLESDKVLWEVTQDHAATSFVPSEVRGLTAGDSNCTLRVSIKLTDNSRVEALLESVQFAGPPVLHSIDAVLVNSSAAVNWFDVTVNASDRSPLTYEFWIMDTDGVWSYSFASNASANIRVTVPSTRDVLLRVVVTNTDSSSTSCNESCPLLAADGGTFEAPDIVQDATVLLDGGSKDDTVAAFAAGIDSTSSTDELQDIFATFLSMVRTDEMPVSAEIFLLYEFVHAGVLSGALEAIDLVGSRLDDATAQALDLFLKTVDDYGRSSASVEDPLGNIADLDTYLSSVCVSLEAGSPPDGEASTFEEDAYALSCSSTEAVVDLKTDGAALVTSVDQLSTVTLSEWKTAINTSDSTEVLSGVYGFHIDNDGEDQEDAVDVEDAAAITISVTADTEAARKAVSCKYFDEASEVWSERGVVLLGLSLDDGTTLQAICSTSHFTLFAVFSDVVDTKFASLANRIDTLNDVDVTDPAVVINMLLLVVVGGMAAVFVVVILVAKVCSRKTAVKQAAVVFEQEGSLHKPSTIGSREYEAILRKWVTGVQTVKLLALQVLTSNSLLGLFFHWDHESIVFDRADKATVLFGTILMTFVSSAFLFDPEEEASTDFIVVLFRSLVSAMLTNVLLLPVQHFLPHMVSNVNSVDSFTPRPVPLLKREMQRISCWTPAPRKKTDKEIMARVLDQWVRLTLPHSASVGKLADEEPIRVASTEMHVLCVPVKRIAFKKERANQKLKLPELAPVELKLLVAFQRRVRRIMRESRSIRAFEFHAWYSGLWKERRVLVILSIGVMVVMTAFTLWICFLLSGTFGSTESVLWMVDVTESFAVQVLVTDPAMTLLVIFTKLFVSWILLQRGKKRRKRELEQEREHVEKFKFAVSRGLSAAFGRAKALKFVHNAGFRNKAAIEQQVEQQIKAKQQFETDLDRIRTAKEQLLARRPAAARPNIPSLEQWTLEQSDLARRELRARNSLEMMKASLNVLRNTDDASIEDLQEVEQKMVTLQRRLDVITKQQADIATKEGLLEDKSVRVAKKTAVHPVTAAVARDHPQIARPNVLHIPDALVNSTSYSQIVPVETNTANNRRSRQPGKPSQADSHSAQQTDAANAPMTEQRRSSRMRRKIRFGQTQRQQAVQRAPTANQAAAETGGKRSGPHSQKHIKAVLRKRALKRLASKRIRRRRRKPADTENSTIARTIEDL